MVWTTRIRNIWTDTDLTTAGQLWRTALALVFTVFAVLGVAAWVRARRSTAWSWTPTLVRLFTVWTIGVWSVRAVQIGMADHDAGFKLVHTVLAVASAGIALWADHRAHVEESTAQARPTRV